MKIRKANSTDVPAIVALNASVQEMHAEVFPTRFRRDAPADAVASAFNAMLNAPSSYWLVAEDSQLVGFLSAEFRQRDESWCLVPHRVCYLAGIAVAPESRRKGIARALVAALRKEADARGIAAIELDVWTFNSEAREAFARLGFTRLLERMTFSAERPNKAPEPTPGAVTPRATEDVSK